MSEGKKEKRVSPLAALREETATRAAKEAVKDDESHSLAVIKKPIGIKPTKKVKRRNLSFWLHLYLGWLAVIGLTIHGAILTGIIGHITYLPLMWALLLILGVVGTYLIRRRLTVQGGVIPRRAARTIWLSFFLICVFWPASLWVFVTFRELPSYIVDLAIPSLFLLYTFAKTLERANISEPYPWLLTLACLGACLTTLTTFGFPNTYFLAASWVGVIIILPHVRQLISWE